MKIPTNTNHLPETLSGRLHMLMELMNPVDEEGNTLEPLISLEECVQLLNGGYMLTAEKAREITDKVGYGSLSEIEKQAICGSIEFTAGKGNNYHIHIEFNEVKRNNIINFLKSLNYEVSNENAAITIRW
jgi:hypothetical protein